MNDTNKYIAPLFPVHRVRYPRKMYRTVAIWLAFIIIIAINCAIDFKVIPSIPLVILQVFLEPVYWFFFWVCLDQFRSANRDARNEKAPSSVSRINHHSIFSNGGQIHSR